MARCYTHAKSGLDPGTQNKRCCPFSPLFHPSPVVVASSSLHAAFFGPLSSSHPTANRLLPPFGAPRSFTPHAPFLVVVGTRGVGRLRSIFSIAVLVHAPRTDRSRQGPAAFDLAVRCHVHTASFSPPLSPSPPAHHAIARRKTSHSSRIRILSI